ncbi:unnamed protein product [Paramecium primaurelia]|uniref:Uncharacterized protein n=1 Tax=Paramecium primaurelia TaxID=5886 RepID=A0A8S1QVW5_PARPR|nr:unnamed protein product [Paramecium primaurelia]
MERINTELLEVYQIYLLNSEAQAYDAGKYKNNLRKRNMEIHFSGLGDVLKNLKY